MVLSRLFGSDNDGCGQHHFGEKEWVDSWDIEECGLVFHEDWDGPFVVSVDSRNIDAEAFVFRQQWQRTCQHHLCLEQKTGYARRGYLPRNEIEDVLYSADELEDAFQVDNDSDD